jgi:WXG100 family type VII secretion target
MVTAANQVDSALAATRADQTRLAGIHDTLVGTWKGEASAAFSNAFAQFNADFGIVLNALNGIQERLVGSHANYTTVETANTETMSKIAQALNH